MFIFCGLVADGFRPLRLCLLALRQLVPPEVCALKLSALVERGLACPQVQVLTGATGEFAKVVSSRQRGGILKRKIGKDIDIGRFFVFLGAGLLPKDVSCWFSST